MLNSFMVCSFRLSVDAIVGPTGLRKKKQLRAIFAQHARCGRMPQRTKRIT
ncbi:hypothetical protein [Burkholderia multivorans]|uniref:hypothetical protein n=1 Tax=Burkholderia multivorans TaxID=87883 RepID=UPI001C22CDE3|nr:hypothetical protein [Burkholderia multivorans]MBU9210600.1 hypothetical protein [Burkholderia multivorans]MCO1463370.1 hypothetical protein [Burkholderia multivorans]